MTGAKRSGGEACIAFREDNHPDYAMVVTRAEIGSGRQKTQTHTTIILRHATHAVRPPVRQPIRPSSMMLRRSALDVVGHYNHRVRVRQPPEDYEWGRVSRASIRWPTPRSGLTIAVRSHRGGGVSRERVQLGLCGMGEAIVAISVPKNLVRVCGRAAPPGRMITGTCGVSITAYSAILGRAIPNRAHGQTYFCDAGARIASNFFRFRRLAVARSGTPNRKICSCFELYRQEVRRRRGSWS